MNTNPAITTPKQPGLGTPSDIVATLYGSDRVDLRGFGAEPMAGHWLRPGVQFVSASIDPTGLLEVTARRRRTLMIVIGLAFLFAQLSLLMVYLWHPSLANSSSATTQADETGGIWAVTAVRQDGLLIKLAGTTAPAARPGAPAARDLVIRVPVGAKLPSGEILVATSPERGAYTTSAATVILNPR